MRHVGWVLLTLAAVASALNPIEVQRQDFVDSATGKRFEIIGVDYQPGGEGGYDPSTGKDPLSDGDICLRDAALMQRMGLNTIRAYNLNPDVNHDACASIFDAVGIYMVIDVNSPLKSDSLDRNDPEGSYVASYLNRTFAVIEAFRGYDNLIGFFSGNEIVNDPTTAEVDPPYIRAVTRDLKQYVAARGGRSLPIGYSAADFRDVLVDTSNYLQCDLDSEAGDTVNSRSDFFALNSYSWCGGADFETSTYDQLAADFAETTIPVFFSEFGCIVPSPRVFSEIPALYGPRMTTWSGGLVYQWTEEGSPEGGGYGLVTLKGDGSVAITPDFNTLQTQYSKLDFDLIEGQNATARNLVPPMCSADMITDPNFSTDFDLPEQPDGVAALIRNGVPAANGSIIEVTKTAVDAVVTEVDGSVSTGLTITPVSSAYRPSSAAGGAVTAVPSGTTSSGASPTTASATVDAAGSTPSDAEDANAAATTTGSVTNSVLGLIVATVALWLLV